jgi:glycosyltransferase involved in cell wall biosynthesis
MRILNCFLDNRHCGATLRGRRVARELRNAGIETVFVLNQKQKEGCPFEGFDCRVLHNLQMVRKEDPLRSFLRFVLAAPHNVWMMCRWIRRERIDVVQVNGIINVLPALAGRLTGRRILWLLNDMSTPPVLIFFLRPLVRRWSWRIGICAAKLGDYYFGHDPVARQKFVVLYPPVETDIWRPDAVDSSSVERFKRQFDLVGKRPIIAAVGNINPAKGYEFFVEMARHLRRYHPSAVFVVAGSRLESQRKYADAIDRQITQYGLSEAFQFLGYWQDVRVVLAASDVYVMSSVKEGTPTVVLEAMAMGRPIVATDVGGVREEIEDGLSGVIVPSRNGEALSDGVRQVLAMTPEQRLRMTDAARHQVERVFDIHQVIKTYLRLFGFDSNERHSG